MKIASIAARAFEIPLVRPYAVAHHATDAVSLALVRIELGNGVVGLGAAAPVVEVTGETFERCMAALQPTSTAFLRGRAFDAPAELASELRRELPDAPAARAALDIALHDAWANTRGAALVDALGRVHDVLPTSVTIGIRDVDATLAEAREYLSRGFRVIKVKIGQRLELDLERLTRLRELVGDDVTLRVDANLGYDAAQFAQFLERTRGLDIELIEQPLPPAASAAQRSLAPEVVARLVADESLHDATDAAELCAPPRAFGGFNIKLMKCGGIAPALELARIAAAQRVDVMWGCMDESVIGIAAALHAAFASPATRYLDLDGSLDLSRDFARGGFALDGGVMRTLARPGLGVELAPEAR